MRGDYLPVPTACLMLFLSLFSSLSFPLSLARSVIRFEHVSKFEIPFCAAFPHIFPFPNALRLPYALSPPSLQLSPPLSPFGLVSGNLLARVLACMCRISAISHRQFHFHSNFGARYSCPSPPGTPPAPSALSPQLGELATS